MDIVAALRHKDQLPLQLQRVEDAAAVMWRLSSAAADEIERLRAELDKGYEGAKARVLGNVCAVPPFLLDGSLSRALSILLYRIERCGASVELTAASSLCSDLYRAVDGDLYAQDRVMEQILSSKE